MMQKLAEIVIPFENKSYSKKNMQSQVRKTSLNNCVRGT